MWKHFNMQSSKMLCNGKPLALEILEFSDAQSLEFHPGGRMIDWVLKSIIFFQE